VAEPSAAPNRGRGFDSRAVGEHYRRLAARYSRRANVACARAYARLLRATCGRLARVVEVGAGSGGLLGELPGARRLACDLSLSMLVAGRGKRDWPGVVADAAGLPFGDGACDGLVAINLLEHLPEPARFVREAARILSTGGRLLVVTPNGDAARLLGLLERLRLKLPEGPHRFLTTAELGHLAGPGWRLLEHRRFLAFPLGPAGLVERIDRLLAGRRGRGLFQYLLLERSESRA